MQAYEVLGYCAGSEFLLAEEETVKPAGARLSPLQVELRQICRAGDMEGLKSFLANNPSIDLDFTEPESKMIIHTEKRFI